MQIRRLTFWGFACSLLLLALFVQVEAIKAMKAMFAVSDQSDRVLVAQEERVAETVKESIKESTLPPEQQLVAHVLFNEIELSAEGTQVEALVDEVPNDSVVTGVEFKLSISQEEPLEQAIDPQAVKTLFSAPGSSLLNLSADRSEVVEEISPSEPSQFWGGRGRGSLVRAVARTTEPRDDFDGSSVQGAWAVKLIAQDASLVGRQASVTLLIHYRARVHLPELKSGGEGARAAIHRLPAPLSADNEDNESQQTPNRSVPAAAGWQTIKYEGFEGAFPNGDWIVGDLSDDGNERYWDDDDDKPSSGSRSAWSANGGADGLDPEVDDYPNHMESWMIYGPFDLSDALDAETVFDLWYEIEADSDYLFFGVSADGQNFRGLQWNGSSEGFQPVSIRYPDWLGESTVWVGWKFYSDGSGVAEGPFVDEIEIRKSLSAASSTPTPTRTPTRTPTPTPTRTPTPTPTVTGNEVLTLHAWVGQESINIDWTLIKPLSGNLDRYQLKRNADGGNYRVIHSDRDNQYTDADPTLTPNVEYCYQVEALDSANNVIGYSNENCAEVGKAKLWIPDQVVEPNAQGVPVTINLANGNGLCIRSLDITISYDNGIAQANGTVLRTIYTQNYAFQSNTSVPGQVKISSVTGANQCVLLYGPGSLFDVFFTIQGNTGQVSPLDFVTGLNGTVIYDSDDLFTPIPLILHDGSLIVGSTFTRGDINGDEAVNSADAALALDISSQSITPTEQQEAACDVNADAACNSADSSLILCYAAFQNWNSCIGPHRLNRHSAATEPNHRGPVEVKIGAITSGANSTIRVPVELSNADGFTGGDFTLTYDPKQMMATGASLTQLMSGFELRTNSNENQNENQAGMFKVSLASNQRIVPNGTIFEMQFRLTGDVSSIDFASIHLHDFMGRDFQTSVLQRDLQLVPHEADVGQYRLYLPAIIR
ncbi:MAG: cohesin domain-containing protein [Ardenticatenaceae bacterium]